MLFCSHCQHEDRWSNNASGRCPRCFREGTLHPYRSPEQKANQVRIHHENLKIAARIEADDAARRASYPTPEPKQRVAASAGSGGTPGEDTKKGCLFLIVATVVGGAFLGNGASRSPTSALSESARNATVTVSPGQVNGLMHTEPSFAPTTINGHVPNRTTVEVLQRDASGGWCKVRWQSSAGSIEGWMHSTILR